MLTLPLARQRVADLIALSAASLPPEDEFIILDEATIERPWGWVFFYTSPHWRDTQDFAYAIAGNAPYLVERESGTVHVTGTAYGIETYIANYERSGDPHATQRG
jgi:hypothetical protein